jgi:hypothetical protein
MSGAAIQCFLIEPTGQARRYLRRFVWSAVTAGHCPNHYHDAKAYLDILAEGPAVISTMDPWAVVTKADPRWPARCAHCEYTFNDSDQYQLTTQREYVRRDTGERGIIADFPAGAMWWATWLADEDFRSGMDHHSYRRGQAHLIVKTPAGDWDVDGPSENGNGWARTGDAPLVAVRPSVWVNQGGDPSYHGFLGGPDGSRPGFLVEC